MQAKTLHKIIHCAGRVSALLCKFFLLPAASESPYTSSHIAVPMQARIPY